MHEPSFFSRPLVHREAILVRQLYGYGKVRLITSEKRYCTYLPAALLYFVCSTLLCLALPRLASHPYSHIESSKPSLPLYFLYIYIYINPYPPRKKASQPKKEKGAIEPELKFGKKKIP